MISVFTIVFIGAGMFWLNPWYLAGFVLTVPAYVFALRWYLRTAPAVYTNERTAQSQRGQDVLGTLNKIPTITAHRLEDRQLNRISHSTWSTVRWAMRSRIVQNGLFGRLNITEAIISSHHRPDHRTVIGHRRPANRPGSPGPHHWCGPCDAEHSQARCRTRAEHLIKYRCGPGRAPRLPTRCASPPRHYRHN